jgi:membrane-bound lytic murein transglycosylase D
MMKKILLLVALSIGYFTAYASKVDADNDTTLSNDALELENSFDDNLDSLLNMYYVQNSPVVTDDMLDTTVNYNNYIFIPDSVYIERLSRIPTEVKLTYNQVVRRFIEMYTQKKADKVEKMLGMAEYYFPIFDDIFDYYGVPNEIKYMSIIESALNARARSRTRAIGLWQFMYGTGKHYGLSVNSFVDERRDTYKSTQAAARFTKDLYTIYQDWQLVVAAYNCGPGNVNKAIRRAGGKRDFWDIYRYLPRETRGHVPAFIAAIYTMNYYKEHNLVPKPVNIPLHTDTIMVTRDLHLMQVSEVLNIPIEQLRDLNPQYIRDIIPARGGLSYPLTLPLNSISKFIDMESYIYAYKDSIYFNPKELLKSPDYNRRNGVAYVPAGAGKVIYIVEEGDNLGFISEKFHVNVNDLREWNDIYGNKIRVGQKLIIYTKGKKGKVTASSNTKPKETEKTQYSSNNKVEYYTVKNGDTLWDIAKKYPGISQSDLRKWNDLGTESKLFPGQKIKIMKM